MSDLEDLIETIIVVALLLTGFVVTLVGTIALFKQGPPISFIGLIFVPFLISLVWEIYKFIKLYTDYN